MKIEISFGTFHGNSFPRSFDLNSEVRAAGKHFLACDCSGTCLCGGPRVVEIGGDYDCRNLVDLLREAGKPGRRIQQSYHGAGRHSVQIIVRGKLVMDWRLPA